MKAETRRCLEVATNVTTSTSTTGGWKYLISIEKFSSSSRLFRVTAYVLRFIYNTRANKLKQERRLGPLSTEEILDSEVVWLKELQKTLDQQTVYDLSSSLGPFSDSHGITSYKGRLVKSDLPYETRCPALIPPSLLTTLIIRNYHGRVMHNGVKETVAELRTRYWLVNGRKIVKAVISSCSKFRKLEGLHYSPPPTAQHVLARARTPTQVHAHRKTNFMQCQRKVHLTISYTPPQWPRAKIQ